MKTNEQIVIEFNDCINSQNLTGLDAFMTDDHSFIDTENSVISGKEKCLKAWEGFFAAFPDYRNNFTKLTTKDGAVLIEGFSTCSEKILDGPALWTAIIENGKIKQWQVYNDTEGNRKLIQLL